MLSGLLTTTVQIAGCVLALLSLRRFARTARSDGQVVAVGVVLATVMGGFLYLVTPPHPNTSDMPHLSQGFPPGLPEPWVLLRFDDFDRAYWVAGQAVLQKSDALASVYKMGVRGGFVNLPVVAYAFLPVALVGDRQIGGLAFSLVGGLGLLLSWWMVCGRHGFNRFERAAAFLAMASFGPLIYSVHNGNVSHLLLPAIVWGVALGTARRDFAAGLLFGVLAIFKPLLGLIGVYMLLRGRFRAVLGAVVSGTALLGLSLAIFGWDTHVVWLEKAIAPYSANPLPAVNLVSIASFIARFETGLPGYTDWDPHALTSGNAVLVKLLSIALLAVFAWAALAGRRHMRPGPAETECELHLTLVVACLISTLCWSHYFVWLLPALAYVYARSHDSALAGGWRFAALAGFALMAPNEYYNVFIRGEVAEPFSNFVVSYRMFGALLLFAVLVRIRRHLAAENESVSVNTPVSA